MTPEERREKIEASKTQRLLERVFRGKTKEEAEVIKKEMLNIIDTKILGQGNNNG